MCKVYDTLQTETPSTIPVVALVLMRSIARLIAAYACGPVVRIRYESDPFNATVTVQAMSWQLPPSFTGRNRTRTRRTVAACENCVNAANTRYSAYVRACWLIVPSPTISIRTASSAPRIRKTMRIVSDLDRGNERASPRIDWKRAVTGEFWTLRARDGFEAKRPPSG
jgi:hypothetical protein